MHQIQFRLGLRPNPTGGTYSAPQNPELDLGGYTSKGGGGGGREGERGEGKGGKNGRDPQGLVDTPMFQILKNTMG